MTAMKSPTPPDRTKRGQRRAGGIGRAAARAPADTVTYDRVPTQEALTR